jgi:hypothetical protein
MQLDAFVDPVVGLNVPSGHSVGDAAPMTAMYEPAGAGRHVVPPESG